PTPTLLASFFKAPPTTEIYTLSLHDALPIWPTIREAMIALEMKGWIEARHGSGLYVTRRDHGSGERADALNFDVGAFDLTEARIDRKSTRLNSSHVEISYAVFCLKKKKNTVY